MPRIKVIADDGWVALDEFACEQQTAHEHYRRCLSDRLHWAIRDAEQHAEATGAPVSLCEPASPALAA